MPGDIKIPKGLVFFPPGTSRIYRRRRVAFAIIAALATLSVLWPVYPFFSRIYPMLFNLPFSLSWLILWLLITMAGMLWLYRTEKN